MPYSEGIYEDMNKVMCLQIYWQKSRTTEDILKEYLAFEYSPDVVEDLLQAVRLLEATCGLRLLEALRLQGNPKSLNR